MKYNFVIKEVHKNDAGRFVQYYHYSPVFPRLTKHYLGIHLDDKMVGVLTLGWGTQPKGTIKKLFPEYDTKDYYEIGKMCMADYMPRNSETQMLKAVVKWTKLNCPAVQLLYTMADGIVGKCGYVYQAFSFYYGGDYWTDIFISDTGEKVHPRTMRTVLADNLKWLQENNPDNTELQKREKLFWPTIEYLDHINWKRIKGKMFRYMIGLNKKTKRLLHKSNEWRQDNYPKDTDLSWKQQTVNGYINCGLPEFNYDNAILNKKNIEQFVAVNNLEKHFT